MNTGALNRPEFSLANVVKAVVQHSITSMRSPNNKDYVNILLLPNVLKEP